MITESLITEWFVKWEKGDYLSLPISENFQHTSPFGRIDGKKAYLELVENNRDKFLGQTFDLLDELYEQERACVRYVAKQSDDFKIDVSEWFYIRNDKIEKVVSYYHIGEIRDERKLEGE